MTMPINNPGPFLSVVVKCYNEGGKIDLCLRSLVAATAGLDAEIVVCDSLSEDRSVEIACKYPVRVVQLTDPADRRCGAVAQLGFQFARGEFVLLMDGDMELLADFLPAAIKWLGQDAHLAGVGGRLVEMSDGIEFRERQLRPDSGDLPGEVRRINGCGLYRAAAIRDVGYLMDRNLHCFEEFELGLRLRAAGWRLRKLEMACVRHHGHRDSSPRLLVRRWRTRFFRGYGELLRATWGRAAFADALKLCRIALLVAAWWVVLAVIGATAALAFPAWAAAFGLVTLAALPWLGFYLRKRSLQRASHAFLTAQFSAASLIGGLLARRIRPRDPIAAIVLRDEPA
jgi:GT2 family glycosyltransferase